MAQGLNGHRELEKVTMSQKKSQDVKESPRELIEIVGPRRIETRSVSQHFQCQMNHSDPGWVKVIVNRSP